MLPLALACGSTPSTESDASASATSSSTATSEATSSSTTAATTTATATTTSDTTTATTDTSESTTAIDEPLRVFFVGNSYTFTNDLPTMVETIADGATRPLDHQTVAVAGAKVVDHLANPAVIDALAEPWDVVVLQGQSFEPVFEPEDFVDAVVDFAAMMHPESELVLFETWARREGAGVLLDFGLTAAEMQEALTEGYAAAATASGATVAPVGQAWAKSLSDAPRITLHISDDSHPTVAGTFLASSVFFEVLTGGDPTTNAFTPNGLDPADADTLEAIALAVVDGG